MRRSKQTAKRAVYSLFPLSLSAKKQADREACGFAKGAYSRVRDRRQNASATKVCAAYSLSKPKGAYFFVVTQGKRSTTQYCAAYSLSQIQDFYSPEREEASRSRNARLHPKGAYLSMQKNMALRRLFTFTNSGLLFSRTRRNKQVAERAASPEGSLLVVSDRGETQA